MVDAARISKDGFLIVGGILDKRVVAALVRAVESLGNGGDSGRKRGGVVFARRNLLETEFVRELVSARVVRDLVESIDGGLVPVRAILFDKAPGANWCAPWHQDRSIAVEERIEVSGFGPWSLKAGVVHVQPPVEILQRMVTLRFHLDDCGIENGPLRVMGGSHHRILNAVEIDRAVSENEQSICVTEAGGLLIMRPLLLHASSPARIVLHRRVVHIEFGPPSLPSGLRWAWA